MRSAATALVCSLLLLTVAGPAAVAAEADKQTAAPTTTALRLFEPRLHIVKGETARQPAVALTFDACMGSVDERIVSTLVQEQIASTIFVTARWLKRNPATVALFLQHPDLFEIENHGENHLPAIGVPVPVYGIPSAGSPEAVAKEVANGAAAIVAAGFPAPHWFRGATARYDGASVEEIRAMGFRIAGFSLNGDDGSILGAASTERRIAAAKDGEVIISHINQPTHAAGQGVAAAILKLKAQGVRFVRFSDVELSGDHGTTVARPGLF